VGLLSIIAGIFSQEAWKFGRSILLAEGKIKPTKAIEMPNGRTLWLWGESKYS